MLRYLIGYSSADIKFSKFDFFNLFLFIHQQEITCDSRNNQYENIRVLTDCMQNSHKVCVVFNLNLKKTDKFSTRASDPVPLMLWLGSVPRQAII